MYITTNPDRSVLYVGVTNDIGRRLAEHYESKGNPKTFAGKYHCYRLLHYERYSHIEHAISREKEVKKWRREKKLDLIKTSNPEMIFLNYKIDPDA